MKKNSIVFIFSGFNELDFDVIISYKNLNSKIFGYESGWNIWSIKTIKSYFQKKKLLNILLKLNLISSKIKKIL